jgi:deoxyribodipyrimidine photo-lyase
MAATTIVWFRHDLRLDDNPALAAAAARGAVVPAFIWAPDEEAPWEPGAASRWWLHQSLEKLAAALAKAGSPLVVRRGGSLATLRKLAGEVGATHVTWNRRYEPAAVKRDTAIKKALTADGLAVESFNGGLLHEPAHVATKEGRPYQVFTPFWRALLARDEPAEPVAAPKKLVPVGKPAASLAIDDLDLLPKIPWAGTMAKTWSPGEAGARKRLDAFLDRALSHYGTERDRPDHAGTSCLSPHLHFGELSPRRAWHAVRDAAGSRRRNSPAAPRSTSASSAGGSSPATCSTTFRTPPTHRCGPTTRGSRGRRTPSACGPGSGGGPGSRSWMPGCGSSGPPAGCTTACG